jgi:hypothetical protein
VIVVDLDPDQLRQLTERFAELFEQTAVALDAVSGLITYERKYSVSQATPYELWYGINSFDALEEVRQHPRGYYWANLLSEEHVERLGGIAQLEADASLWALQLDVLGDEAGRRLAVLRIKTTLEAYTDDELAPVKTILDPILIHRPYEYYEDYPVRILKDAQCAYYKIPPGSAPLPSYDDDPTQEEQDAQDDYVREMNRRMFDGDS